MYNILLALDGSEYSKKALELAVEIATNIKSRINILFVVENKMLYHPYVPMMFSGGLEGYEFNEVYTEISDKARESIKKVGRKVIDEAADYCKKHNVEYLSFLREGILSEVINSDSIEKDIIIMGLYGLNADHSGSLLGSSVEEIARTSKKPLMVSPLKVNPIQKIAVAFDNSEFSNKTLRVAFWIDRTWEGKLEFEVFSVVNDNEEASNMKETIDGLIAEHSNFSSRVLLSDDTADMIVNHVHNNKFSFLMMGAYGHSRIRELILGSTTSEVIRKAELPVLLYR